MFEFEILSLGVFAVGAMESVKALDGKTTLERAKEAAGAAGSERFDKASNKLKGFYLFCLVHLRQQRSLGKSLWIKQIKK